ncbi:MAG: glycosyltransferase family 4 protein [Deltaproteobacteria bacterium]|nr:glycosyltransferase family 4 protein [Deltaproteobacteria bacterium]
MAESVHTARWIRQVGGRGWDTHLFPVEDWGFHPELKEIAVHDLIDNRAPGLGPSIRRVDRCWPIWGAGWVLPKGAYRVWDLTKRWFPLSEKRAWRLARTIRKLRPDLIHSLEFQRGGYLALESRRHLDGDFPPWIVSNWGSDIYLFGRLRDHIEKINAVLSTCDYYACECQRDVELARSFGFKGEVLPVLPNAGGYDIEWLRRLREPGDSSGRRLIVLKGHQNWAGRALVGLRAIELCADVLRGYRVAVYSAAPEVEIAAELLAQSTGLTIEIVRRCSHEDMLRLHGQARVSIGLSISDAISTSLLEAMIMGSFPIQSDTSCANEWVVCGETAILVHPDDPRGVARALRRAVTDDALVDRAAEINAQVTAERLDRSVIQPQVIATYEKIAAKGEKQRKA